MAKSRAGKESKNNTKLKLQSLKVFHTAKQSAYFDSDVIFLGNKHKNQQVGGTPGWRKLTQRCKAIKVKSNSTSEN